jgi:Holliday junction resolvase RusA-like endonuclease
MKYSFEILEKAIGKERPRYNTKTHTTYTPQRTKDFEEKVRWSFVSKYNIEKEASYEPFRATITAIFKPPVSTSQKKLKEIIGTSYMKKPDVDNIAKAILDSLNGLPYKDDNQVVELLVKKEYGLENRIIVELEEINQ